MPATRVRARARVTGGAAVPSETAVERLPTETVVVAPVRLGLAMIATGVPAVIVTARQAPADAGAPVTSGAGRAATAIAGARARLDAAAPATSAPGRLDAAAPATATPRRPGGRGRSTAAPGRPGEGARPTAGPLRPGGAERATGAPGPAGRPRPMIWPVPVAGVASHAEVRVGPSRVARPMPGAPRREMPVVRPQATPGAPSPPGSPRSGSTRASCEMRPPTPSVVVVARAAVVGRVPGGRPTRPPAPARAGVPGRRAEGPAHLASPGSPRQARTCGSSWARTASTASNRA